MQDPPYEPIDCSFHDRLEAFAILRTHCRVVYRDLAGEQQEVVGRITDLAARDGAEFLTVESSEPIRMDRLVLVEPAAS